MFYDCISLGMSNQTKPRLGIAAVAAVMLLMNLTNIAGPVSAKLYVLYWGYIAYLAFRGDSLSIFNWVKWAIWVACAAGLAVIALGGGFLNYTATGLATKEGLLFSLGLPVVVKVLILIYLHGEVNKNPKESSASSTPENPELKKAISLPPVVTPTPSSFSQNTSIVRPASDGQRDVRVEQTRPVGAMKTDTPNVFSSEEFMSTKPIPEIEKQLLYDGNDPSVEKRILNRISFSKDAKNISSLLWIEGDLSKRSRLIEKALADENQGFLKVLEANFESRLAALNFTDNSLRDSVVNLLRAIQKTKPLEFDYALSVAMDLGDDLDLDLFTKTFVGEATLRELDPNKHDAIVEQIFRRSPPGEKLSELLNSLGFKCSVVWSSSGGRYDLNAKGNEYKNLTYEGLKQILKEEVFREEFMRLEIDLEKSGKSEEKVLPRTHHYY